MVVLDFVCDWGFVCYSCIVLVFSGIVLLGVLLVLACLFVLAAVECLCDCGVAVDAGVFAYVVFVALGGYSGVSCLLVGCLLLSMWLLV